MAEYKAGLRANGIRPPKVEAKPVGPEREYRKVPMERLMARLDLDEDIIVKHLLMNQQLPVKKSTYPVESAYRSTCFCNCESRRQGNKGTDDC